MNSASKPRAVAEKLSWPRRIVSCGVSVACVAVLATAARLNPSPTGVGTHTQLGLPPDPILKATGVPMPGCGMTTSFAWFVRGNLLASIYVEPMGAFLAALTAAAVPLGFFIAITARPVHRRLAPLVRMRVLVIVIAFAALSWAWKVLIHVNGWGGWRSPL